MDTPAISRLKQRTPDGLTFVYEGHEYAFNGQRVPSVTQLLAPIDQWDFLDAEEKAFYGERGTAVHTATELDDLDDLHEPSVVPEIAGYLKSWRLLRNASGMEILSVEEYVYHPLFVYAGRIDRRALINGRHAVIDIKAGVKCASHGVQLAGYKRAWNHTRQKRDQIEDMYTAYLNKDGSQGKLEPWTDPLHDQAFVGLLSLNNWSRKYA